MALQRITPCLWFDSQAEEAAKFYTSIFKNSKITRTADRFMAAMLKMKKIDLAALNQAFAG